MFKHPLANALFTTPFIFAISLASASSFSSSSVDINKLKEMGDVQSGQFIPSSLMGAHTLGTDVLGAAPQHIQLVLEGLGPVEVNISESKNALGRTLLKGTLMQAGVKIPFSEVILVEAANNTVMGSIETPGAKWLLMPDLTSHQQYLIKRETPEIEDEVLHEPQNAVLEEQLLGMGLAPEKMPQAAPDKDNDGNTVIDLFMGFSEKALPYVQDKDAFAIMQIATVNNALKNSDINNIRIRLVGTGVTHEHQGMDWHQLRVIEQWFAEDIAKYSPDIVTGYMLSDSRFQREAGGWAFVGGSVNINDVRSSYAFRHELGHNMGGGHCNDGAGYNFGYNNGTTRTHQCGNGINYYSNPDVTDMYGLAIGDPTSANMAKTWRDNAAKHSSNRPAIVPFDNEQQELLSQTNDISLSANQWLYVTIEVPANSQRLVVTTTDGAQTHGGNVRLYAKAGGNPTNDDYDVASLYKNPYFANSQAMGINNPQAGSLTIGIKANAELKDLQLNVYSYNDGEVDTGSGTDTDTDTGSDQTVQQPSALLSPQLGDMIEGGQLTLQYQQADSLWLYVGTGVGGNDLFDGAVNGTSKMVSGLPQDGSSIFITLWTFIGGQWKSNVYEFVTVKKQVDMEPDTNTAPQAKLSAPLSVLTPNTVTLDGSRSLDEDGDTLRYIWQQISGDNVTLSNANSAITTFTVPSLEQDARVSFMLTVFDGELSDSAQVEILLKAVNNPGGDNNNGDGSNETDNPDDDNNNSDNSGSDNNGQDTNTGNEADSNSQNNQTIQVGGGSTSFWLLPLLGGVLLRQPKVFNRT